MPITDEQFDEKFGQMLADQEFSKFEYQDIARGFRKYVEEYWNSEYQKILDKVSKEKIEYT